MLRDCRQILSVLLGINTSSGLELWQKHIRSRDSGHDQIFSNVQINYVCIITNSICRENVPIIRVSIVIQVV